MNRYVVALTAVSVLALPTASNAQSTAEDATASTPAPATWTSDQRTDAVTRTRNCSVYPLRTGLYPLFFLDRSGALMSIEGADATPIGVTLQVDDNAGLDGGFPEPSEAVVRTLMDQVYAGGERLRVSRAKIVKGKLESVVDDIPLAGAVAQFEKCADWVFERK
ncbi:hypothetical protein [Cognatilysobacter segetis]|uniref:hypothetical protein n=1 Tax=Cognatilysobacter segetis TaxID=2492394 RepID=UPI00105F5963|nr:hypothetical protein [Lysobacter segetis]